MFLENPRTEKELKDTIETLTNKKLKLKINKNKSRYLSFSKKHKEIDLSIHQMFLIASNEILEMLCKFLCYPKKGQTPFLRKFVNLYDLNYGQSQKIKPRVLRIKGVFFDLEEVKKRVNQSFFTREIDVFITWFDKPVYRKASSVTFGSYDPKSKVIRINKLLDHATIPLYFVEFIVYHEMLHHEIQPKVDTMGRKWVHTSEFRKREKSFPEYKRAKQFGKNLLKRMSDGWA